MVKKKDFGDGFNLFSKKASSLYLSVSALFKQLVIFPNIKIRVKQNKRLIE